MLEEYAQIAATYDRSFELPYRRDLEVYSVLEALGPLEGLSVLDLACGTGFYSREIKRRGAARVVGVDLSPEMIATAQQIEKDNPLGIDYLVQDAADLNGTGDFDIATGVHLLHYATSAQHLAGICAGIATTLRPGGRFIGWQVTQTISPDPRFYEPNNIFFRGTEHLNNGDEYFVSIRADNYITPEIPLHYWNNTAYQDALTAAGFHTITWHDAHIQPEHHAANLTFWEPMRTAPLFSIVQATRA
ncbi:class I SAM-dependent methyltransferase [Microbispora sp. ATCC PTA-5024]|uniref:class I SAM-dependent methyltransferase n=1 Tax=Microbispora sp. ATCC PTA-5024 TaxID=316330 RepID=UPI0012ECF75A|nr:class I SAM-dependent methyltransferase [Microbispora sp. ATCC PTA-5024]